MTRIRPAILAASLLLSLLTPDLLRAETKDGRFHAAVDGRVGFGQVGEDYFISIAPGASFRYRDFSLAIHAPLRFRVIDEKPDHENVLRDEDWNEVSDFTRILRFAQYGERGDPLYVRLGELVDVSLGHGSIVHRYFNTAAIDHYQTGIEARYDAGIAGGELLLDNVVDPNLFGVRGFVRPLAFMENASEALSRLEIGITYASDYQAPAEIRMNGAVPLVTQDGELSANTEVVTLFGLDLAWPFPAFDKIVEFTPYFDVGFLDRLGSGIHVGLLTDVQTPMDLRVLVRLEYRFLTRQYAAGYINSLYEIERYGFPGPSARTPKVRHLTDLGDGAGRHGGIAELSFVFLESASVTVAYEDYEGPSNSSFMARVRMPWIGPVLLQAFWSKREFEGAEEAFDIDGTSLVAEAQVHFLKFLYAYALYAHQWHLVDVDADPHLSTRNDWSVGVGATWEF